ncbi:MAG TPA: TlpA disulfide reductase family protein [Candidatus Acidoferrales bacterium]|nr:TlpA disulfide reductase family protein [Candidatus Acidoferrales bacterium]
MLTSGDRAPDLSLPGAAGGHFTLSEALQKAPVLAAFFKVSCGTCQFTFPFVERLYRAYGNGAIAFWGISQDDREKTHDFCNRFGVTFPAALDWPDYKASRSYGFTTVPSLFLVGSDGRIRFTLSGFSKAGLIQLAKEMSGLLSLPVKPVFLAGEPVPELKPG